MFITIRDLKIIISEARAEVRHGLEKTDRFTQIKQYVDNPNVFFTMTYVDKLGINPKSEYNTPLGIYSYPLNSEFFEMLKNSKLPYQTHAPFIQVFAIKDPSKVINFQKVTDEEAFQLAQRAYEIINEDSEPLTERKYVNTTNKVKSRHPVDVFGT